MHLHAFNSAPSSDARDLLRPCVDIPRWVDEVVQARPFGSVAQLASFAEQAADPWTPAEIDGALAHHPRIGERAAGSSTEADMSRSEQGSIELSSDLDARLRRGNQAYEEKFGRVFLVRAAGRSAEEILAQLEARVGHTPEEELPVVGQQLREIAILRLEGVVQA